jgi:hypothetical protein
VAAQLATSQEGLSSMMMMMMMTTTTMTMMTMTTTMMMMMMYFIHLLQNKDHWSNLVEFFE